VGIVGRNFVIGFARYVFRAAIGFTIVHSVLLFILYLIVVLPSLSRLLGN